MATIKEQIELIRAEIDKTQKNKATNAHIGKLKAKIAQLKIKEEKAHAHSKASGGGKGFTNSIVIMAIDGQHMPTGGAETLNLIHRG